MENKKPSKKRYIGKVKKYDGKFGVFQKILIDNTEYLNADGTPNTFYKGNLLWIDGETGKQYIVKLLHIKGVSAESNAAGFTNSIMIDLLDEYCVKEIK